MKDVVSLEPGDLDVLLDCVLEKRADSVTWKLFRRALAAYVATSDFRVERTKAAIAYRKHPRTWSGRQGLGVLRARGSGGSEHNYHCIVCGENLATYAGGHIMPRIQDRMMQHVGECLARSSGDS